MRVAADPNRGDSACSRFISSVKLMSGEFLVIVESRMTAEWIAQVTANSHHIWNRVVGMGYGQLIAEQTAPITVNLL